MSEILCPKCKSNQLTANQKGYSVGKAAAGVILTGGVGLLGGFIGSKKTIITCIACGNKFKPGEGLSNVRYNDINNYLNKASDLIYIIKYIKDNNIKTYYTRLVIIKLDHEISKKTQSNTDKSATNLGESLRFNCSNLISEAEKNHNYDDTKFKTLELFQADYVGVGNPKLPYLGKEVPAISPNRTLLIIFSITLITGIILILTNIKFIGWTFTIVSVFACWANYQELIQHPKKRAKYLNRLKNYESIKSKLELINKDIHPYLNLILEIEKEYPEFKEVKNKIEKN